MKKFNSSKHIIIALSIVIVTALVILFSATQRDEKQKSLPGQSLLNSTIAAVDNVLFSPLRGIESGVHSIGNLFNTFTENNRLKKRIDENAALHAQLQAYKKENAALKEQLKLNNTLLSFDQVSATVINRSPGTWEDILIIDKGTNDGVQVNMPVMGNRGLIGRIIVAEPMSAKVELLTTSNKNTNQFPVMIESKSGEFLFGLTTGYDESSGSMIVTQLPTVDGIEKGATVSTSGLGKHSPKGLLLGDVKEVRKSRDGVNAEVFVTPASSMYDISAVTVVQRLAGNE